MRGYPGSIRPDEKSSLQSIREKIRRLATQLPDREYDAYDAILRLTEANKLVQESPEPERTFNWNGLPSEIKNMIYKLLFVSKGPIQPYERNHGLAGSFLYTCRSIHNEALPILLGANIFEMNEKFYDLLGVDNLSRRSRGRMIKSIIVPSMTTVREERSFNYLTRLAECVMVSEPILPDMVSWKHLPDKQLSPTLEETEFEDRALGEFVKATSSKFMRHFVKANYPRIRFFYFHEFLLSVTDNTKPNVAAVSIDISMRRKDDDPPMLRWMCRGYHKAVFYSDTTPRDMPLVPAECQLCGTVCENTCSGFKDSADGKVSSDPSNP